MAEVTLAAIPDGFAEAARTTPVRHLQSRYHRSERMIYRWLELLDIRPYKARSKADDIREFMQRPECAKLTTPHEFVLAYYGRKPTAAEYGRAKMVWYEARERFRHSRVVADDDWFGMRRLPLLPEMLADLRAAANADTWARLPRWIDEEEAA